MDKVDKVLPFQLEKSDIKGRMALVSNSVNKIIENKGYPLIVSKLIAEACTITSLVGQSMELRWKLSIQIRGSGPIKLIATDYFNFGSMTDNFRIRGHASFDQGYIFEDTSEFSNILSDGYFAIIIDEGVGKEPYQAITPLEGKSLSECAENFFHQSEQLPTRFSIKIVESDDKVSNLPMKVGGFMLQYLAKGSEALRYQEQQGETNFSSGDLINGNASENWKRTNLFLDTLGADELFDNYSNESLLYRLFNDEEPRVFQTRNIEFGCTCSPDKVRQTMSIYSQGEIKKMTNEAGKVTAECQFCKAFYSFKPEELGMRANRAGHS